MARPRPKLTDAQRETLAIACYQNALQLSAEALLLLTEGSVPRGAFLTFASFEEFLKALYCESDEHRDDPKAFWAGFRSHETKMQQARRYVLPEHAEETFARVLEIRERCLYVDTWHDGRALTPGGLVEPGGLDRKMLAGWLLWIRDEVRKQLEKGSAAKKSAEGAMTRPQPQGK